MACVGYLINLEPSQDSGSAHVCRGQGVYDADDELFMDQTCSSLRRFAWQPSIEERLSEASELDFTFKLP